MNNSPLFPYERNRYYAGKMLTSADFAAEQMYMNNKRRFLNQQLFGAGIVCGCNVYSLDDLSIFIESGFAIDSLGREILIDTSVVKKLSAIDGFERIDSSRLTLCVRYQEEEVHPVYSVNRQNSDSEYEYNRIREGYSLFLEDTETLLNGFEMETEFLAKDTLYQDEDYEIWVEMPATVCKNRYTKLVVKAIKHSDGKKEFSYRGCLQLPAFLSPAGSHELELAFENLQLTEGESVTQEYWVFVEDTSAAETVLMQKNESDFSMKILLSDITPGELVDRELGKISLEMRGMGETQDFICLADISLVRTDSAYIIEHIEERGVKRYIEAPSQSILRSEYLTYFKSREPGTGKAPEMSGRDIPFLSGYQEESSLRVATGTLEIPVGGRVKAGEVYYSGEIMHGLGAGTIYVALGQELIEGERVAGANLKSTIYGDTEMFKETSNKFPDTETAVKVLNDKGSFVAAARFLQDTDALMLTYRWIAIRLAGVGVSDASDPALNQWLEAETPTVVLGTRESYYFGVRFHNMEQCSISYELSESGSGDITLDGVYTAPNKEGVYEIRIYCTDRPILSTYAYAIVKNTKK